MSYSRAGEDSDVYVYCNGTGFCIHVSHNRINDEAWTEDVSIQEILENRDNRFTTPLPGPLKGKYYFRKTRTATISLLTMIRRMGYRVPNSAISRLRREIKEEGNYA